MAKKNLYYIIHKPYKVLSQFTDEHGNPGLGSIFKLPKDVYPVGRLDLDSEGLLILTNDKSLTDQLLNPKNAHERTYWVEVEGVPNDEAILSLKKGVKIKVSGKEHLTKPAKAQLIKPDISEREPPVNYKKHPVRSWLEIKLIEGKNRQVRRMTAKVGHPTLRLVRVAIEELALGSMKSGDLVQLSEKSIKRKLKVLK